MEGRPSHRPSDLSLARSVKTLRTSKGQRHLFFSFGADPAWRCEASAERMVEARPLGIRGVWAPTVAPDGPLRSRSSRAGEIGRAHV